MIKFRKDGFAATFSRICEMVKLKMKATRIVDLASRHGIPVYSFTDMNGQECADLLEIMHPDLLVIASAPILKPRIFEKAKLGCLNPHPGWLPKYRGVGANAYAIQQNDKPGVTIHYVDQNIDTGKIIVREHIDVLKNDTIAKINDRAMARGAELMADVIHQIRNKHVESPEINEPQGLHYRSMPYPEVKLLNRQLRKKNQQ